MNLSWFNLGRGPSAKRIFANRETDAPLFTVCNYCGHLDSQKGENSKWDHRPWCPKRTAREEETVTVALSRTLQTQGVLLHIPVSLTAGDNSTIPSLTAAIKLGFKEVLGGDPEHLNVVTVRVPDNKGDTVEALLMHDNVPGGTGYLSQFASPEDVRRLMEQAFVRVKDCSCADDERMACPDCLLPYTHWTQTENTSRAAAERALRAILTDQDRPAPETDPLSVVWETQSEAPSTGEGSNLEVKFREVLRKALEDRKAVVKDLPNAGQVEWLISFTNGEQWKMSEQVDKGYTKPDFLLTHRKNPNARPVAVYTDGKAFHISHAHYRFPDDIAKRNRLHYEESWLPWNITNADIDWFQGEQKKVANPPAWTKRSKQDKDPGFDGFGTVGWDFLTSSPVNQLLDYLASPQQNFYSMAEKALVKLLSGKVQKRPIPGGAQLTYRDGIHLQFSVSGQRLNLKRFYVDAPTADSITEDNWQDFLRFANILWLADAPVIIATSEFDEAGIPAGVSGETAVSNAGADDEVGTSEDVGAWAEAIEEFEGESDVVAALQFLASIGAEPTEEIGEEVGTLPTAVVWPDHKIALMVERDDSYEEAEKTLRGDGWTLMYPDTLDEQTIPAALLGKE